ncbi:hypothetical protein KI440_02125 [Candidatus Saccharibacteria bacterium TM7i]|nr:hypothetical protein KI440_02125 [Candidatus Saccharibacteria bacterium TM7i]
MYPNGQNGLGGDPSAPQDPYQAPVQGGGSTGYEPQQPNSLFQVQPEPAPQGKKKLLVALLIAAGVLILIVGVALYVVLTRMQSVAVKEEEKVVPAQSAVIIQTVKKTIKEAYPAVDTRDVLAVQVPAVTITDASNAPVYQPDGYQYKVQYDNDAGFNYVAPALAQNAKKPQTVSSIAENVLKNSDLTLSTTQGVKEVNGAATRVYTGRGVVCAVQYENAEATQKGLVNCGDSDTYTKIAADMQPFADSLNTITPETTVRNLVTADSDAGGYQRATVQIIDDKGGRATAYFYKKDAGRWLHLVTSKDPVVACAAFTSVEMQRAFLNVPCKDAANANAKVQVLEAKR